MSNGNARADGGGPGSKPAGLPTIVGLSSLLLLMTAAVFYFLIILWPYPTPSTAPSPQAGAQAAAGDTSGTGTTGTGTAGTGTAGTDTTGRGSTLALASDTSGRSGDTVAGTRSRPPRGGAETEGGSAGVEPSCRARVDSMRAEWAKAQRLAPAACVRLFGKERFVWDEQRLLVLVMLGGALGSLLHALRSLGWYVGNRELVRSWALRYLVLGFTGAALAFVFYVVIRGGFFSPNTPVEATSPFGFVAFAALVGLFSEQAILKLKQVAETLLAKPGPGEDARPQNTDAGAPGGGRAGAPTITGVEPHEVGGVASGAYVVTGSGFDPAAEVWVGGVKQQSTRVGATELRFTPAQAPTAGTTLKVEVRNPDGRKATFDAKV